MYKHILLPTDGSELSRKAMKDGLALAKALGAKVTGLYVIVETNVGGLEKTELPELGQLAKEAADKIMREFGAQALKEGVPHESLYLHGDSPWEKIIDVAARSGCDLICMASHGRRGLAGVLLGSQTNLVLTNSKIPVLVSH